MAQSWPWLHGLNQSPSAARLSARVRQGEALAEAQSALEQFCGFVPHARDSALRAMVSARGQQIALRGRQLWEHGPAAWIVRLKQWAHIAQPAPFAVGAAAPPAISLHVLPRFLAHAGLLVLLLILVWGGGFRGALAQPVQTNEGSGGDLAWQWYRPANDTEGVLSTYASLPAMPIVVQRPHTNLEIALPTDEVEEMQAPTFAARTEVMTYTVQKGDTLISIAVQYGVSIETLYWFNSLKSADLLAIDQKLRIPPVDGLAYEVEEGDTLDSIAEVFEVRKGNLIAYAPNNLREPYTLAEGQELFVPGASKAIPRPPTAPSGRPFRLSAPGYASLPGGERFSWPTSGRITDRFGWTGTRWHNAIDIAAPWGTPIYAAAAGTVSTAGWQSGYGYMVTINHSDGWETRYGHMAQQPEVSSGQWVERGQLIGYIGCTGNCTGPHVHFEIRFNGANANPLDYLP
jgi:murein DD-endopeptidase MepM/ murein hydrolase activator NlpD